MPISRVKEHASLTQEDIVSHPKVLEVSGSD
uniref:Uncharacterized protein n=1 Tax=Musa acuminata subsp. malaccensis TaxID=214687 RepID=A0A804JKE8_MUSAM